MCDSGSEYFFYTKGPTIRKVMGGGGGEFSSRRNFFRYQIPCMNFFQALA